MFFPPKIKHASSAMASPLLLRRVRLCSDPSSIRSPLSTNHHQQQPYPANSNTLIALARAHSSSSPPDLAALFSLLTPHSPHPESLFPPFFRAFHALKIPLLAVRLFHDMLPLYLCRPSIRSVNSCLTVLAAHRPDLAVEFYERAVRECGGVNPNVLTFNLLMKAEVGCGRVDAAVELLREMGRQRLKADVYGYSTVVDGLCRDGRIDEAMGLLDEMQVEGVSPTTITFNTILHALCQSGNLKRAYKLKDYMILKGCPPNVATYNTLIHGFCLKGKVDTARALYDQMVRDGCTPNEITYGTIIDALFKLGKPSDAVQIISLMGEGKIRPNEYVYSTLINGFFRLGDIDGALSVWDLMKNKHIKPNTVIYSTLIDGYCKHGRIKEAEDVLDKMMSENCLPNLFTYNSLIFGYFKNGKREQAMAMWQKMVDDECEPNKVSYSILINGLCEDGKLKDGLMVWKNMLSKGHFPDTIAYTSMIKGLCRAGNIDGGMRLFNEMLAVENSEPDVVTYNLLFDTFLKRGKLSKAMILLGTMLDRVCDPDIVTCNIFLNALMEKEGKGREFLEGLIGRLCKKKRIKGAAEILHVMIGKYFVPEINTWDMVVRGICDSSKVITKEIDKCWKYIWR